MSCDQGAAFFVHRGGFTQMAVSRQWRWFVGISHFQQT
ncbi:hypothetical protein SALB1_3405 [Salinisphaera sp. LB1]|nr:hypothetical protein SALB1_3405 [Salinisphaera sp. LB1]